MMVIDAGAKLPVLWRVPERPDAAPLASDWADLPRCGRGCGATVSSRMPLVSVRLHSRPNATQLSTAHDEAVARVAVAMPLWVPVALDDYADGQLTNGIRELTCAAPASATWKVCPSQARAEPHPGRSGTRQSLAALHRHHHHHRSACLRVIW